MWSHGRSASLQGLVETPEAKAENWPSVGYAEPTQSLSVQDKEDSQGLRQATPLHFPSPFA
eukprot:CAMPEP_0197688052 /NCGR_PEP_ID=MMETSP1338-20131121/104867_1 /TAXON_ID=43686 ORGANISM="Pelagodinium beii, Strain RCC1491" /NCGR_SAMPLE_ID=MMETSP1338 /ASSEMBLY_ACC=CAM_ASM_000754 /LENGTH=60 /DNA_ID=CAMNT_0043270227 /DNA_START=194 /DNA_END=375 /DNA_ORIENTATION=+